MSNAVSRRHFVIRTHHHLHGQGSFTSHSVGPPAKRPAARGSGLMFHVAASGAAGGSAGGINFRGTTSETHTPAGRTAIKHTRMATDTFQTDRGRKIRGSPEPALPT